MSNQSEHYVHLADKVRLIWPDLLFCACLFSMAIAIGMRATVSGPGVTPDSAEYISMATNIYRGHGFVADVTGPFELQSSSPMTLWPPGYPLLAAALMILGANTLEAIRLVPIISYALLVCATYWLGRTVASRAVAITSSISTLVLMPVVQVASFAWSEMVFMLFATWSVVAIIHFVTVNLQSEAKWLVLAGLCTAMAILTRYVGASWFIVGLGVVGYKTASSFAERLTSGRRLAIIAEPVLYITISLVPIAPWLIRNKMITGYLSGVNRSEGGHLGPAENLRVMSRTIAQDLVPSIHLGIRSALNSRMLAATFGLAIVGIMILIVFWRKQDLKHFLVERVATARERMMSRDGGGFVTWLILVAYLAAYVTSLLVLSNVQLFPAYDWPRYLVVIYPLVMVLWAGVWTALVGSLTSKWLTRRWTRWAVILLPTLLWIGPYAVQTAGFVANASLGQGYTTAEWRNHASLKYLSQILAQQDLVYSNEPNAIVFLLSHPAKSLPYVSEVDKFTRFIDTQPVTPGVREYIIMFKGEGDLPDPYFRPRLSTKELATLAQARSDFQLVADFQEATIYRLGRANP